MFKKKIKQYVLFFLGMINYLKFLVFKRKAIQESELVFFLPFYHTGGAEKVHLNILKALKGQKCFVIFTQLSATKNFYDEFNAYAQVSELNNIRNKKSAFLDKILKKRILESINLSKSIHTVFGCNTDYFYELLPGVSDKIKRVDLIHALGNKRNDAIVSSSQFIDCRVCINTKAKDDIISIYKRYNVSEHIINRLKIINNGVEVDQGLKFTKINRTSFKFGFIGRWSEEKRPEVFLEVAKLVRKTHPDVSFVMAGTGMKPNLEYINESGVKFLGEITNETELKKLYKSLAGVIISSEYEGFPMVFMESMIFGTVPISTDVGGIGQHIKHMENGILIQNTSRNQLIVDFSKHIISLISNQQIFDKLSESAKLYAVENFDIDQFNKSYQELFLSKS